MEEVLTAARLCLASGGTLPAVARLSVQRNTGALPHRGQVDCAKSAPLTGRGLNGFDSVCFNWYSTLSAGMTFASAGRAWGIASLVNGDVLLHKSSICPFTTLHHLPNNELLDSPSIAAAARGLRRLASSIDAASLSAHVSSRNSRQPWALRLSYRSSPCAGTRRRRCRNGRPSPARHAA